MRRHLRLLAQPRCQQPQTGRVFYMGGTLSGLMRGTYLMIGAAEGSTGMEGLMSMAPLVLIFVIFYFLLIRPQQKKQQEHKHMLDNLKRGDRIITTGGIYGTIESLAETTLQLKIASQAKITISRSAVAGLQPAGAKTTED
jgi:preprotein translocase subunit YajC